TTGCPTGGTQVGGSVALAAGSATSANTTAAQTANAGLYCWRAEYTPDAAATAAGYVATTHTNNTTECFTVATTQTKATTSSPTGTGVTPGTLANDTFTISGNAGPVTGGVTFWLCGPSPLATVANGTTGCPT